MKFLVQPEGFRDGPTAEAWFARIADRLLNYSRLMAGGEAHRLLEVEVYYYGEKHFDPFAHRDPIQLHCGRWYFHRGPRPLSPTRQQGTAATLAGASGSDTRGYRGGNYKGLDLVFSDGRAFGGILFRALETTDGTLIDGPSLCVDHLLARTGCQSVAQLDSAINGRLAWDQGSPLWLREIDEPRPRPIFSTARVGLSLKRAGTSPDFFRFLLRPYRFLTEPRRLRKGKPQLVLALHAQGVAIERIRELTGSPIASIRRYVADFKRGLRTIDWPSFVGRDFNARDLGRMHGAAFAELLAERDGSNQKQNR